MESMSRSVAFMRLCTTLTFDGDPVRLAARVRDLEAAGVDMVLIPEIYGFDQVSVLGFVAASTERIGLMTGIVNVYLEIAGTDRPDGGDDRRAVGRAVHARPRHIGGAGDRGLARGSVHQAAGPHPRHDRHLPQGVVPATRSRMTGRQSPCPSPRGRARASANHSSS